MVLLLLRATTCTICTMVATLVIMLMPDPPLPGGVPEVPDPGSALEPGGFCVADEPVA